MQLINQAILASYISGYFGVLHIFTVYYQQGDNRVYFETKLLDLLLDSFENMPPLSGTLLTPCPVHSYVSVHIMPICFLLQFIIQFMDGATINFPDYSDHLDVFKYLHVHFCHILWEFKIFKCKLVPRLDQQKRLLITRGTFVCMNIILIVKCYITNYSILYLIDWFLLLNATFSNISAISWRPVLVTGGRSRSTRREPSTMSKQLVDFITCFCESSAPFCNL